MSYKFTNGCSLFLILFKKLLFLLILYSADLAASIPCQSKCDGGGITIPYPFGIGNDCYLDKSYEIECRKTVTSRKLVPFLSLINKEVVSISLPNDERDYTSSQSTDALRTVSIGLVRYLSFGTVRVRNQVTSTGCSTDGKDSGSIINLKSSPFFVDGSNSLLAVGCNSKVSLTNITRSMVGCELNCNASKESNGNSVPFLDRTGCSSNGLSYSRNDCTENKPGEAGCDGDGCCQVSLPYEPHQVIGIRIESNDGDTTTVRERCKVAFLTDEVYTLSNGSKPEELFAKGYATLSLGWAIKTNNISFIKSLACGDKKEYYNDSNYVQLKAKCICDKSSVYGTSYANCGCISGYTGNPYIVDNCTDINECQIEPGICGKGQLHCENTPGYFYCVADKTKPIMIGVGAGLGVLVLVAMLWWLRKLLIKRRMTKRKKKFFKRNGGLLLQQELNTREGSVDKTRIFTSRELEKATEKFSENRVLGHGGQGTVYKGMLVDGRTVAVKKSKVIDEDKLQEFINEVVILSQINHRHVVKLLGCCLETEVPILVYEFIINGNLFQHIHEESDDYSMVWNMRLRIAVDIAGALSYLHSSASSPIYHRDIKSTNILLDEKYRAKVADFGTSRSITIDQTHWTTVISGTVGYVDPEYYRSSQYTVKSDVYSFGVVLAELITGNKPVITVPNSQEISSLVDHFRVSMKENRFSDIIDVRIRDDCKLEQVTAVANLAMKCLRSKGKNRPNMREVLTELERICISPEDSQVQIQVDEDKDEEEEDDDMRIINRSDSWSVGVSAPPVVASSSSCSDVEPLFPRLTW